MESAYLRKSKRNCALAYFLFLSFFSFCLTHSHLSVVCLLVCRLLCLHTDEDYYLASISQCTERNFYESFFPYLKWVWRSRVSFLLISILLKMFFLKILIFNEISRTLESFHFYYQDKIRSSAASCTHCYVLLYDKERRGRRRRRFFWEKMTLISLGRVF